MATEKGTRFVCEVNSADILTVAPRNGESGALIEITTNDGLSSVVLTAEDLTTLIDELAELL